jgi:HNH/endonuclease VII toxin of polymorphic toxin system
MLVRYGSGGSRNGCCPSQTGHHLVPEASFKGIGNYNSRRAPVICAEGPNHGVGTHGQLHTIQSYMALNSGNSTLGYFEFSGGEAVSHVFPECECDENCTVAQLRKYHEEEAEIPRDKQVSAISTCDPSDQEVEDVLAFAKAVTQ